MDIEDMIQICKKDHPEIAKRLAEQELELLLLRKGCKTAPKLTGSEALFGFIGWLTSEDLHITIGSSHECGVFPPLIGKFIDINGLEEPRVGWENNLTYPKL